MVQRPKRCAIDFARRISAAREAAQLTQAEAAAKMGVAPQTYADIERGRRRPRIDTLIRLADALRCEVSDLVAPSLKPKV